jgi:hypothetical protein
MPKEKTTSSRTKDGRTRNWTCVVYPESAPFDWKERLDKMYIPWIESPLHDADLNGDGTEKKPHWHIAFNFKGSKSYVQMKEITDMLCGTIPVAVHDMRGLIRYMAHMDNPEKKQYEPSMIIGHGGEDVQNYLKRTATERYVLIREMQRFIRENYVTELNAFMDYAAEERFNDWFPLMCDNSAYIISAYIKSNRHSLYIATTTDILPSESNNSVRLKVEK